MGTWGEGERKEPCSELACSVCDTHLLLAELIHLFFGDINGPREGGQQPVQGH